MQSQQREEAVSKTLDETRQELNSDIAQIRELQQEQEKATSVTNTAEIERGLLYDQLSILQVENAQLHRAAEALKSKHEVLQQKLQDASRQDVMEARHGTRVMTQDVMGAQHGTQGTTYNTTECKHGMMRLGQSRNTTSYAGVCQIC